MEMPAIRTGIWALALCLVAVSAGAAESGERAPAPLPRPMTHELGWYFSGKGGPTFARLNGLRMSNGGSISDDHASNIIGAFGAAAGYEWMYRYNLPLRTELEFMNRTEVTYDASPLKLGGPSGALASTVQNVTTMAKLYWHFPVNSPEWWPFVSAGLGWSRNTVKSQYTPTAGNPQRFTQASDDLAWSIGTGISVKWGNNVVNDIELRQIGLGRTKWGLPEDTEIEAKRGMGFGATEINFAIRMMF